MAFSKKTIIKQQLSDIPYSMEKDGPSFPGGPTFPRGRGSNCIFL